MTRLSFDFLNGLCMASIEYEKSRVLISTIIIIIIIILLLLLLLLCFDDVP